MLTQRSLRFLIVAAPLLWASDAVVFAQPANFPQILNISTTAIEPLTS